MNKHAKNLRALPVVLPAGTDQTILDAISNAANEIERLDIDAARYQWLRDRDIDAINQGGIFAGQTPQNIVVNGGDLDKAIDEAIVQEADKNDRI